MAGDRRGSLSAGGAGSAFGHSLITDVSIALRGLRRQPLFAVASVGALALGIAGVTTLWTVLHGVMLKPLPYRDADRLVQLRIDRRWAGAPPDQDSRYLNAVDFLAIEEHSSTLEDVTSFAAGFAALDDDLERPVPVFLATVSPNFFSFFGAEPAIGRGFLDEDLETQANARPVVLSHEIWRSAFGADPSIIGRTITVTGGGTGARSSRRVVGVSPPGFRLLLDVPYWQQIDLWTPTDRRGARGSFVVFGHVAPGVSPMQVAGEVAQVIEGWTPEERAALASRPASSLVRVDPLLESLYARVKDRVVLPFAGMMLVLMLACANTANLLLSRLPSRRPELALRAALGAGRSRLLAQLLTEAGVIAGAAAGIGLLIALGATKAISVFGPIEEIRRLSEIRVEWVAVLFCVGVASLSALLFGVAPAWRGSDPSRIRHLRPGTSPHRGLRGGAGRAVLLTSQIAIALVLLASAALLVRSFSRLLNVDLGFAPSGVSVAEVTFAFPTPQNAEGRARARAERTRSLGEVIDGLQAHPAVASAAVAESRAYGYFNLAERRSPAPEGVAPAGEETSAWVMNHVSPGYFETLGMRLLGGRGFSAADRDGAALVAVVNETAARHYWGGESPVGKRFGLVDGSDRLIDVVGVVADAHEQAYTQIYPVVYLPLTQWDLPDNNLGLFVRASGEATVEPTIRSVLREVDSRAVVRQLQTWDGYLDQYVRGPRFYAFLFSLFGALAAVIAAAGVFGVLAFMVSQRAHEIGVRIALGARRTDVVTLIVREVMLLVAIGLALGTWGAITASRVFEGWLFEVKPGDRVSLVAAAALLAMTAVAAAWIPARRAASIDPAITLKGD
jgi:putative ABC transport system permease protein